MESLRGIVEAMINLDKIEEARSLTTKVQSRFIENSVFLFVVAKLLFYSGNQDKAKQFLKEAISKDPDNKEYVQFFKS